MVSKENVTAWKQAETSVLLRSAPGSAGSVQFVFSLVLAFKGCNAFWGSLDIFLARVA